jgi:hypothetical protein
MTIPVTAGLMGMGCGATDCISRPYALTNARAASTRSRKWCSSGRRIEAGPRSGAWPYRPARIVPPFTLKFRETLEHARNMPRSPQAIAAFRQRAKQRNDPRSVTEIGRKRAPVAAIAHDIAAGGCQCRCLSEHGAFAIKPSSARALRSRIRYVHEDSFNPDR